MIPVTGRDSRRQHGCRSPVVEDLADQCVPAVNQK